MTKSLQIYIPIHSVSECNEVQERLFKLGYSWQVYGAKVRPNLFYEYNDVCLCLWDDGDICGNSLKNAKESGYSYIFIGDVKPYQKPFCVIRGMMLHELGEETTIEIYNIFRGRIEQELSTDTPNEAIFASILKDYRKYKVLDILERHFAPKEKVKFLATSDRTVVIGENTAKSLFKLYESSIELALERRKNPLWIVSQIIKIERQMKEFQITFKIKGGNNGYFITSHNPTKPIGYLHVNGEIQPGATHNCEGKIFSGWYKTRDEAERVIQNFFPHSEFSHVYQDG